MKTLRAKTGLRKKSSLSTKKPIKKGGGAKQKKPTVTKLKKKADTLMSKVVRYRDSELVDGEWIAECITCEVKLPAFGRGMQNGHFANRQYGATRYDELNNNAQCYRCNMLFNGEQWKYGLAVDMKYGEGTAKALIKKSREPHQFSVPELEELIADLAEQLKFYEKQV